MQPIQAISQYWEALGYRIKDEHTGLPSDLTERYCLQCGLHFFDPCPIGSPMLYERLSQAPWYYGTHKWEFNEALNFLAHREPARMLEIGCGTGEFLKQARRFSAVVQGIEYNPDAVETCRASGLDVVHGFMEDIQGPVDTILAFQVLEHLENPGETLEKWIEHIVPGGYLVLAVPNQDGILGQLHDDYLNLPPHHATLWEEKSLRFVAQRFNLNMIHYVCEPLNLELYATYSQSLLRRTPGRPGLMGTITRKLASLVHRGLIPYFYEAATQRLAGHSHLAIYQKPTRTSGQKESQ